MGIEQQEIKNVIEAALLAYGKPINLDSIFKLFQQDDGIDKEAVRDALTSIEEDCQSRGVELKRVSSGYRFQAKQDYAKWLQPLWEEKPPRYSRALLETMVLIAYKQPITRGEIEDVRGVSVSSHIIKTLQERDWVRVVGHRDVPGKPALFATTKEFLDYFNLSSLEQLPSLAQIKDLDKINEELDLDDDAAHVQADINAETEVETEAETEVNVEAEFEIQAKPDSEAESTLDDTEADVTAGVDSMPQEQPPVLLNSVDSEELLLITEFLEQQAEQVPENDPVKDSSMVASRNDDIDNPEDASSIIVEPINSTE